jgi:hypothetical protein
MLLASAMALSRPLNFPLTCLSRLLIVVAMTPISDYKNAYETSRRELADLLALQERVEKRLVVVRQTVKTLAELCESEGVTIESSAEANYLLENSSLADEIRRILAANYDKGFRPSDIRDELKRLGHHLSQYQNPQSTIHMVLKRMVESGDVKEKRDSEGKANYLMEHPLARVIGRFRNQFGPTGEIDPNQLPENIRDVIYGRGAPLTPLPSKTLTPGEAKRMMERHRK